MAQSVTKKVRLSPSEARRLRALAREVGRTESEVMREGLDLVERRHIRECAVEDLIAMIDGPEPKKIRWSARP